MLELVGLFLAIIDFAGYTEKLEAAIDGFRESLWRFKTTVLRKDVPIEKYLRILNAVIVVALTIYLLYVSRTELKMPLASWPVKLTVWIVEVLLVGVISYFATALYLLAVVAILLAIYLVVLSPLVFILRVLDMPPKGTVGSIGLILALASALARLKEL